MRASMHSGILWAVLAAAVAAPAGSAQSILQTVLGGAPDGVVAAAANLNTPAAVVCDGGGNIYLALRVARQVVRIDPAGIVKLVAGSGSQGTAGDGGPARAAQLTQPVALALDAFGNLYIADAQANRIRKVSADGTISTFAGNGKAGSTGDGEAATAASLRSPAALAFDVNGNLLIADSGNHVVRMVTLDGRIVTIAGNGSRSSGGNGGAALDAGLDTPYGVASDGSGNIYIADTGNDQIRVLTPDGNIDSYAGRDPSASTGGFFRGGGGDPSVATNATLSSPAGMAMDPAGNMYFIDAGNVRVRKIASDGTISNYAGTGTRGAAGDGGVARSANLSPEGLALDGHGNLLIADGTNNRLRIVTAADGIINTLAGTGLVSYDPRGILVDGDNVYFSDGNANRVRRFNRATGAVDLVAGDGVPHDAGAVTDALTAGLTSPRGLAMDSAKNLYIADSGNHKVRRVTPDGQIGTVAGTGTASSTGDGGPAAQATLTEPWALAFDAGGSLYIAERSGHRVRKMSVGGSISTVAGTGTASAPDQETGVATSQTLWAPQGLAFDGSGGLLIADTGNNRVRRLTPDGTITTVAGTGDSSYAGDGGPATAAVLRNPGGVAGDAAGNVYIADTQNQAIRLVGADGIITTVAGRTNLGARTGGFNGDGSPATDFSLNQPSSLALTSPCVAMFADTSNQRIRQVSTAVDYTITSTPSGRQIALDGQPAVTPVTASWLPGSIHRIDVPSPQDGAAGTRYVGPGARDIPVACGAPRAAVALAFGTQFALAVTAGDGGTVSQPANWQDAGAHVTLTATPSAGFVFAAWQGDCTGTAAACQLTMDGPKTAQATFTAAAR